MIPVGPQAGFLYHTNHLFVTEADETFYNITGVQFNEWVNKSVFHLMDKLAIPDHLRSIHTLFGYGMEALKKAKHEGISFNLEFDMADHIQGAKRMILQFSKKISTAETKEPIGQGRIIDVDHMCATGHPILTIIEKNAIVKRMTDHVNNKDAINGVQLSEREMEVLRLKSKGMSTQQIAKALKRSTLTIYSVVRDIKYKTGMELIPLIKSLHEKGLID